MSTGAGPAWQQANLSLGYRVRTGLGSRTWSQCRVYGATEVGWDDLSGWFLNIMVQDGEGL